MFDSELRGQMAMLMAGRAAEELTCSQVICMCHLPCVLLSIATLQRDSRSGPLAYHPDPACTCFKKSMHALRPQNMTPLEKIRVLLQCSLIYVWRALQEGWLVVKTAKCKHLLC